MHSAQKRLPAPEYGNPSSQNARSSTSPSRRAASRSPSRGDLEYKQIHSRQQELLTRSVPLAEPGGSYFTKEVERRAAAKRTSTTAKSCYLLDWDGTMVPTTAHRDWMQRPRTRAERDMCDELDRIYVQLFETLTEKGHPIYLVTNASVRWFLDSLKDFPRFKRWLADRDWKGFVSARDLYQHQVLNHTYWKYYTFMTILKSDAVHQSHAKLVCVSDLDHDLDNCSAVTDQPVEKHKLPEHAELDVILRHWRDILSSILQDVDK